MTHPDDLWTGVVGRPKNTDRKNSSQASQRHLMLVTMTQTQSEMHTHTIKREERAIQVDDNPVSSQHRSRCVVEVGSLDSLGHGWGVGGRNGGVLLSALSRASCQSRQRTDPLIFTAPGCFDSKPNDRTDTSILYEDLSRLLTMAAAATQLMRPRFQLLLHVQCFDIKLL